MCFRPTTAAKAKKCPSCGALNPGMAKQCIKCKTPLEDKPEETKPEQPNS